MSVVLQDTVLFAASVLDNIRFGAANTTEEQIEAAARGQAQTNLSARCPRVTTRSWASEV